MNELPDPLEAELAAVRPREPSAGLKARIAAQIDHSQPIATARRRIQVAFGVVLALVVAACLLLAVALRHTTNENHAQTPVTVSPSMSGTQFDPAQPTVWAFHRAVAAAMPEEIDLLLDRHAATAAEPTEPVNAFPISTFPNTALLRGL